MKDIIVVAGSPGTGKSTICKLLQQKLQSPYIDFGWLREWHLRPDWSDANPVEEGMAFDNVVYMLRNYLKHGYKNVIVTDFQDQRIGDLARLFAATENIIISLVVKDDEELKRRVLGVRDSGYRNFSAAIEWNRKLIERPAFKNEYKFDNTLNDPELAADEIMKFI